MVNENDPCWKCGHKWREHASGGACTVRHCGCHKFE